MTFPTLIFLIALVLALVTDPGNLGHTLIAHNGMWIAIWYLLAFGLAPAYAYVYWLRTPQVRFVKALGYAHVFTLYSYQWLFAGWWAVYNVARGRSGWAKTARTPDAGTSPPAQPSTQTTS